WRAPEQAELLGLGAVVPVDEAEPAAADLPCRVPCVADQQPGLDGGCMRLTIGVEQLRAGQIFEVGIAEREPPRRPALPPAQVGRNSEGFDRRDHLDLRLRAGLCSPLVRCQSIATRIISSSSWRMCERSSAGRSRSAIAFLSSAL